MHNGEISKPSNSAKFSKKKGVFSAASLYIGTAVVIGGLLSPLHAATDGAAKLTDEKNLNSTPNNSELIAKFKSTNWSAYAPPHLQEIAAAVGNSAALQAEVLQGFQEATDNVQRHHFCNLLRASAIPGFPAKAFSWARDSENVKTRLSSFTFLSGEEQTPEIEALFLDALMQEKDVEVIGQVVLGLRRGHIPAPEMVDRVVARLHALSLHASAEIRMGSIQRMAEWDKALRFFPGDLMRLLTDPDSNVRTAAIGATSLSAHSTAQIKSRLLEIFGDSAESVQVRHVAYLNLDRYDFTKAEFASYQAALTDFKKAAAPAVAAMGN